MYVIDTTDPLGRRIRLKDGTWQEHILGDKGRSEFENFAPIKSTLEQPHMIVQSGKVAAAQVFFRLGAHPEHPDLFVKVPVLFRIKGEGTVSTAMLQPTAQQGVDSTLGGLVYVNWRR